MGEKFEELLSGGHPNSLGRTAEVVAAVLADHARLDELFATLGSEDAVVRLRVGDALEKVCRERPDWFLPRIDLVLGAMGAIDQPSVQWHVAQIADHLRARLTAEQAERARTLLQHNLSTSPDWIVRNVTMDVLTRWAVDDPELARWLRPELERLRDDPRRSVATRAAKRLAQLPHP